MIGSCPEPWPPFCNLQIDSSAWSHLSAVAGLTITKYLLAQYNLVNAFPKLLCLDWN